MRGDPFADSNDSLVRAPLYSALFEPTLANITRVQPDPISRQDAQDQIIEPLVRQQPKQGILSSLSSRYMSGYKARSTMIKGSLLGAIALVGLIALSRADSGGKRVSKGKFSALAIFGTSDPQRMENIRVKYCTEKEIEHRRSFCDQVTDEDYRGTCEVLFKHFVELCCEHLDDIIEKTYNQDLYDEYDIIDVAPEDGEDLRTNLEAYFRGDDLWWDWEYCDCDPEKVLKMCHKFIVDYQSIKTILKYNGIESLSSVEDAQAERVVEMFEFCRVFSKHYDGKNKDSALYSDI